MNYNAANVQDVFVGIETVAGYCNINHNTIGDASQYNNIYNIKCDLMLINSVTYVKLIFNKCFL